MWDVSLNQTIERPPCSIAKGDQVPDMVSVGWTNESHSMYISSMEASFMQQLHGHEHHAPVRNRSHVGANGIKVIQEGAMDGLISQKNDSRSRDIGIRCLLENPWMRRFKPRSSGTNRRGDGVGASLDDGESGTDTVQERIPTHVRDLKSCVGENLVDKSSVWRLDAKLGTCKIDAPFLAFVLPKGGLVSFKHWALKRRSTMVYCGLRI